MGGYSAATIRESILAQLEPLGRATASAEPESPEYVRAWGILARSLPGLRREFRGRVGELVQDMHRRIRKSRGY